MMSMVSPTSGNIPGKPSSSSSSSSSSPATILGISPGKPPGLAMSGVGAAAIAASHLPKHPAFAHFLPLMSSLGLTHDGRQPQVISPLSPSSRPGSTSSPVNTPKRKRTLTPDKPANTPDSRRNNTSDLKISMQAMQPSVILTDLKEKKSKGSSSGSDSSCELSSVSKMLTATDAQNFQEYLTIPETEDEQDSMSVSEMSGEDSNLSMENMFSNSYVNFQRARIARLTGEATGAERKGAGGVDTPNTPEVVDDEDMAEEEEEDTRDGKTDMTLTVGMALLDGNSGHPDLGNKPLLLDDKLEGKHSDPSNMSEQEIARLIEKVTRENDGCPTKKKRNSYADSPHKFQCPYCPRCFPWMSSLNRHLLTHTGQKPFRCPRCPVTFSTKSNRERHLIRKHNVNMLDPSSRATMDRPYKCQLCVFSSFSTKSNLIKHYKDRHNGASPPQKALEALDGLDDLEGEDSNGKTCEEEEEEYALAQKLQENGLLHGFYQDSQDPCDSTLVSRDPHKKRNVLFDLSLIDGSKQDPNNALSTSSQNGDIVSNTSNNANSKDNNNNSSSNNNVNNASSSNSNRNQSSSIARSSPSAFKHSSSSTTNLPGIDQTVLTDTVREFLDKSLQQSLEDSQRKALEEGSTFWITPAMERHLKRFDNGSNCGNGGVSTKATAASSASSSSSSPTSLPASLSLNCLHCNLEFPSKKKLQKHLKIHKPDNLPYSCHLCADNDEVTFASRVECLQHVSVAHRGEWRALEEHNGIRNVEVFATRLDKMVIKSIKRGKSISNEDKQDMTQVGKTMKRQDGDGESSNDIVNVFDDVKKEGEDDKNNKDIQDVDRAKKGGSGNNGSSPMKTTTSDAAKKVLCALCPDVFGSRAELKEHMCSHIGNRDSSLTQPSGLPDSNAAPKPSSSSSSSTPAAGTDDSDRVVTSGGDKGEDDGNLDMLHNLLGVESSTIDEIFEARVSAAAILGVAGGKTPAKP